LALLKQRVNSEKPSFLKSENALNSAIQSGDLRATIIGSFAKAPRAQIKMMDRGHACCKAENMTME